jgi:uncharacterized protein YjbJ (UPF0337 family)
MWEPAGRRESSRAKQRNTSAAHGRRELEGKIQQRYGLAKDQARKEIDDWFTSQGF